MELIILGFLILLNGFFALSEIALVSSKKTRLEQARIDGSKGAKIALHLLENSENFLSAIQVGITLIGIVTGVFSGIRIADDITPFFLNFEIIKPYAEELALSITVIMITYASIVIGELVPKTIALNNPEVIARKVAPLISYFTTIFFPFVKMLSYSTSAINKILGIKKQTDTMTEKELRHLIKTASDEGVIEQDQKNIHEKVFYFSEKKARHIMTHRTEIQWLDLDKSPEELKKDIAECTHSKVVCSKGNLENFLGVLDLMDYYKSCHLSGDFRVEELVTEPLIVPDVADAQNVLTQMKQKRNHVCLVINEYGGLEGIVTLFDIIESIVGDIPEENDQSEPDIFVREDNSVLVSGDAPIETLSEIINEYLIDFESIDYSTIAGFVINQLNRLPHLGDKIQFMGYSIEVVDIDGNKVDKVLITKL